MSSKREQIMAALFTALDGNVTGVASGNVFRSGVVAYASGNMPAVSIEPVNDSASSDVVGYLDWSLSVRVRAIVMDEVPDSAADTMIVDIHDAVMADTSLGGLSMDILPTAVNYVFEDGEKPIGIISMDYRVTYRTSETNLSA
jgi:hypothetical protein